MRLDSVSKAFVILLILTALLAVPVPAAAQAWEPGRLEGALYAGFFDTAATSPPAEAGLELRRATALENLAILGGITGNSDGGVWVYGGARYDLTMGSYWSLAPGFAVTLYEKGDGKELGQTLEFRSSIELARRISDRFRVGFVFYHLSNASLSETNPGANSAVLSFAFRRPRITSE